jgi:hypothetical protein
MGILDFMNAKQQGWNAQRANSPYTPDMRLNAGMQSLGLLGGSLMAAGAPTTDPGQFGQIMGQSMAQAGPMMQQSLDQQLQMADMQAQREREAAFSGLLESGDTGLNPEQAQMLGLLGYDVAAPILAEQMFAQSDPPPFKSGMVWNEATQTYDPVQAWWDNKEALAEVGRANSTINNTTVIEGDEPAPFSDTTPLLEEIAKEQADRYRTTFDKADSAYTTLDTIENIRAINLETGSLTSVAGESAGVMRALGFGDLADEWLGIDPGDVEAYSSFANAMALAQKDSALGGGVLSDSDLAMLKTLAADPNNQPLANAIILGAMERAAKLQIAERDALDEWVSVYGSMGERISAEDAVIEGSAGKTFNQYWSEKRGELAAEFRAQDIGANVSLPSINLEVNGRPINQMSLDELQGVDLNSLSAEELKAAEQRWEILNGG